MTADSTSVAGPSLPTQEGGVWAEVAWLPKAAAVSGRASYRVVEEDDGYRVFSNQTDGSFS